eukprot:gene25660-11324_t
MLNAVALLKVLPLLILVLLLLVCIPTPGWAQDETQQTFHQTQAQIGNHQSLDQTQTLAGEWDAPTDHDQTQSSTREWDETHQESTGKWDAPSAHKQTQGPTGEWDAQPTIHRQTLGDGQSVSKMLEEAAALGLNWSTYSPAALGMALNGASLNCKLFTLASLDKIDADFIDWDGKNLSPEADHFSASKLLDNIDADFMDWDGKNLSLETDLFSMKKLLYSSKMALVAIKNNVVYIYRNPDAHGYTVDRLKAMQKFVARAVRDNGTTFPDTIFLSNLVDSPPCLDILEKDCTAPVFTIYKRWNFSTSSNSVDKEVSIPHFGRSFGYLYNYPWSLKENRALLRARLQRSMKLDSMRVVISEMADKDPEAAAVLDAGIVENRHPGVNISGMRVAVMASKDPETEAVLDAGIVENRHPGINISAMTPEKEPEVRRIASNSQHFGYRYLGHLSKVLYLRKSLLRYNALFPEMQRFMDRIQLSAPPDNLNERRPSMLSIQNSTLGELLEEDNYVAVPKVLSMQSIRLAINSVFGHDLNTLREKPMLGQQAAEKAKMAWLQLVDPIM